VVVLNPIQTGAMRKLLMQDSKTDEINTLVIAETIWFGRYKASSVPQKGLLVLWELCRNRFYLIDVGSDPKRKITALLDQVFPEFETRFDSIFCKSAVTVLNRLQSLRDDAASLEHRSEELFTQFGSTLTTITGIGPVLGAVILSEIRDISCFASTDKLAASAGLNPKVKQSEATKSNAVHMSKLSSPYLRRAIAVQQDPTVHP